jgi:hypothetical protein
VLDVREVTLDVPGRADAEEDRLRRLDWTRTVPKRERTLFAPKGSFARAGEAVAVVMETLLSRGKRAAQPAAALRAALRAHGIRTSLTRVAVVLSAT